MKDSDNSMDTQTGKFIARATPLGTVTQVMVVKRAKEVAVTNGRNGNDYTQDDLDEARRELVGISATDAADVDAVAPEAGGWLGEAVQPAKDEQTVAEELVNEGVEEATHHQMLVGNQFSRDQDES